MICRQTSSLLLDCPFCSLNTEIFVKIEKALFANIRKILLMKDRSFLYELTTLYICKGVRINLSQLEGRKASLTKLNKKILFGHCIGGYTSR